MSKEKRTFTCSHCNYSTPKWLGCCPSCKQWETLEEIKPTLKRGATLSGGKNISLAKLDAIESKPQERMLSGIGEWDRVVGGGIMSNSLLILTGDPGIGKSTLLLQISAQLAQTYKVFYFSSEESLQQVKGRAKRIGCTNSSLLFSDQADLEAIITITQEHKPNLVIIDSIQNCYTQRTQTIPGSIGQLREAAFHLMRLAKENDIAIIVSGHITKEGNIAGPKTLEHMVDGVFYLQGEDRWQTRVLRSVKNRFGTINELGFFEMNANGLEEVPNINQHLISEISHSPGSVLVSFIEGSRPLLLELQALTVASKMGIPQRVISGIDHKQVVLIAAILEKYLQVKLSMHDIFFKVGGGFKIKGSSTDLGIALALLSSYFQQPVPEKSMALGEISLTGQIKPINQMSSYVREAEKFGIEHLLVAQNQKMAPSPPISLPFDKLRINSKHGLRRASCSVQRFRNVYELLKLFEGD